MKFEDLVVGAYYENGTCGDLVFVGMRNQHLAIFHGTEYNDVTGNMNETDEEFYLTASEVSRLVRL